MPYGINQEIADATVRILGNNVKLINWFREVEDKFDALTEKIEDKLGKIDAYLREGDYNGAVDNIFYMDLLMMLRASRRSQYGRVRTAIIWLISEIGRLKRMPKEDRPIRAIINQFEVLRNLYTILINEHIENTTMIEDKIVFQIERMTTESARVYDLGMRPFADSDETQESIKSATSKTKDREQQLTKTMTLQPQGIAGLLSA
jgi:hypothetical protein